MSANHTNRLHFTVQGEGIPAVLFHGILASLHTWEAILPTLAGAGYRTYAVDLPGHGDSDKPNMPDLYHVQSVSAQLEQWLDQLQLSQPPVIVGHSQGGYFSLQYCLDHPQAVKALVLIDPFYSPRQLSPFIRLFNRWPRLGGRAIRRAPEWLLQKAMRLNPVGGRNFPPQARQQIIRDMKRASPYVMRMPSSVQDLTGRLKEVGVPSLVIWGQSDITLNPRSFTTLVRGIPGANGRPIENCGHQPHVGKPDVVSDLILQFLSKVAEVSRRDRVES